MGVNPNIDTGQSEESVKNITFNVLRFNPDKDNISLQDFFGEELENIQKARTLVERYQRTVEEGRGKITEYLDPYKSEYRCELLEPQTEDEKLREKYYTTVAQAFKLFFVVCC